MKLIKLITEMRLKIEVDSNGYVLNTFSKRKNYKIKQKYMKKILLLLCIEI